MQWRKKFKSNPVAGDTRTRRKFFWFPTLVEDTYYWLESQLVEEVLVEEAHYSCDPFFSDYVAFSHRWVVQKIIPQMYN